MEAAKAIGEQAMSLYEVDTELEDFIDHINGFLKLYGPEN